MHWRDAELPPPGLSAAERRARQYGVFSFRTGNIYTAATLRQWLAWAYAESSPPEESWLDTGRHFDPFRPTVEPDGHASAPAMVASREVTLAAIRDAVDGAACFIVTLGLTEAWRDRLTGTVYPVCPGVQRGVFDAGRHEFHNFRFDEVYRDLTAAIALARAANPELRIVLTVSPVPLTATATDSHVLVATTYSKSVLRAVAGQLAQEYAYVDYFPSFEIVSGFPFKAMFFDANLRTVTAAGVAFVMKHFVGAFGQRSAVPPSAGHVGPDNEEDVICDDAILDYYNIT